MGDAASGGMDLATTWEAVAAAVPDGDALVHGALRRSWREFESRSARLANHLHGRGIAHDSKVACYLYNGPEYLETTFAAFKVRAVPINVNYRYLDDELAYLLDNADAEAVVFHAEFAGVLERCGTGSPPSLRCCASAPTTTIRAPCGPRTTRRRSRRTSPWRRSTGPATTCGSSTPAARPACPRG